MRPPGHPGITSASQSGSKSSMRMAKNYFRGGLVHPNGLGPSKASQVAQETGLGTSEDECLEKLLQEVDQLRRAGNRKCAAKAFAEGVKLFTAALELKPDATQLLINRALARIMTADPASADEDCCLALALERRLPSAYRWRAAARRDCGWLVGAVEDMRMAARMAPTADKKETALQEVVKLEEWINILEESEATKEAAEECRAREARAPALAAEAKAAFKCILIERRADLARKQKQEQQRRREQETHRKQAEEDIRKQAHEQEAANMLRKMQRSKHVEVFNVDPKTGNITDSKGQTTDIDSFLSLMRPSEARQPSDSSSSGSKVPCSSEPSTAAAHAASQSGSSHSLGTPSHVERTADSSARHATIAPAAAQSRLSLEQKQAHASSAAQSASQSTAVSVEKVGNEPALPFYFAGQQPCMAGESSAAPEPAALPKQAAVDAVLQEIAQKERDAWLEFGVRPASNALVEADSCTDYPDCAKHANTASAEAVEQAATAFAGAQEEAPTVRTKEADMLAAVETVGRKGVKRPREERAGSDQQPTAQKQQVDAAAQADDTSATESAADAPSGPADGSRPEASPAAHDTEDGCVSEADSMEHPAAEAQSVSAATVEQPPAEAAPPGAAGAIPDSKQEPQPGQEAAMDADWGMPGSGQAETALGTGVVAEGSVVPEDTAAEAPAWSGNRSKSQKKKAKRKAKLASANTTGAVDLPLEGAPNTVSEADSVVPEGAAPQASTGSGLVETCTPSKVPADSHSDDSTPAANYEDLVTEPQSATGQEGPLLDSSEAPDGDGDAAAAPATGAAAVPAASGFESPAITTNAANIRKATCEVEATLQGAASSLKAQEAEQTSAGATVAKQGRGLFSGLGDWFGMGGRKQGAASEASGSSREVDVTLEPTSGSATPDEGSTSSPASPSCHEGDYPGKDIYMKARAAQKRGNNHLLTDEKEGGITTAHHYREAIYLCDQALVVNPTIRPAHLTKAACCMHLNMLQEGSEAYASALQHDLDYLSNVSAHAHVDHIMEVVGKEMARDNPKKDVVMALLDAAVRLSRSAEWACRTRLAQGEAYLSFGNVSMAIKVIRSIIDDDATCAAFMSSSKITSAQRDMVSNLLKTKGNALQRNEAWEEAKTLYSMSILVDRANTASWSNRAYMNLREMLTKVVLCQLGLYGEAIQDATTVLEYSDNTKLLDKAHRRRAQAYIHLRRYEEAHTDLHNIKQKRDEDIQMIHCLDLDMLTLAGMERDAPLVVPKDYGWVNELPKQKPALDKSGGVMATRWDPLLDHDAEAGCTKEELLHRLGIPQEAAETSPAAGAAENDAPETSGAASPTCITSGPYASSSEGSSPANAQMSMSAHGVPSAEEGPTAGQGPPSSGGGTAESGVPSAHEGPTGGQGPPNGGGAAGADDGCGSRRPSSSYYTAEPGSPLSDACIASPLSEQQEQTAFMPQNGGHRTSSGSSAAVSHPETSPIGTPSDVSNAGDSSDSDSQPSQRPPPRAVPVSLQQPDSGSALDQVTSNGRSSAHSNGDRDGSQPDTVNAPSRTEPQESDTVSNLGVEDHDELFEGILPGRVMAASSEPSPTNSPKLGPQGPPFVNGGSHSSSHWGAQKGNASWRQSPPALRSGFLNRGMPEKPASRPEPARSSDEGSMPEALPAPPPLSRGFLGRPTAGDASHAERQSEPRPQPDQRSSCTSHTDYPVPAGVHCGGKHIFKGLPGDYMLLQKAAHHIEAGERAFMADNMMDAFEAAHDAMRLIDEVAKQGRTPFDELAVHIDKAFVLKAMVLSRTGRNKDAMNSLTAALKLSKDSHTCRELRATLNIRVVRNFMLAAPDLEKLCELTPPYKPQLPLTARIITLAREEMAAVEQRSAGKAKRAARKSAEGSNIAGFHSPISTTAGSERASGEGRNSCQDIIMEIIIYIAQNEMHYFDHPTVTHLAMRVPRTCTRAGRTCRHMRRARSMAAALLGADLQGCEGLASLDIPAMPTT